MLSDEDRRELSVAVRALEPELATVCEAVSQTILTHQPDLVDLRDPVAVQAVSRASVANVEAILSTLAVGVRPDGMDVPDGALELLDYVAHEPAALPAMLRAYRLGSTGFNQLWLAHLADRSLEAAQLGRLTRHCVHHVAVYVDRISEVIVERWEAVSVAAARAGRRREAAARAMLAGERVDSALLEHPVDVPQLVVAHRPAARVAVRICSTGCSRWPVGPRSWPSSSSTPPRSPGWRRRTRRRCCRRCWPARRGPVPAPAVLAASTWAADSGAAGRW